MAGPPQARSAPRAEDDGELDPRPFGRGDRPWLHTALMILGPLGLLVAVSASLWVSSRRVERSVVVQVEPQWRSSERVAVRAQLLDGDRRGVEGVPVSLELRPPGGDGDFTPLGRIEPVQGGGAAQGMVDLPELPPGEATLRLTFHDPRRRPLVEELTVRVVAQRPARDGRLTVASSTLQHADDSDAQPGHLRIDLRPLGRLLAGFHNDFGVRLLEPDGTPWRGEVEVLLVHGELGELRGRETDPPRLFEGVTDVGGLVEFGGLLSSEVVRIEVVAHHPAPALPTRRRLRLVSFAGGVRILPDAQIIAPGDALTLRPRALRARRPVFIDVHGPDGGWIATLPPVVPVGDAERRWTAPPQLAHGLVQVEAYHYTNAPGEGAAVARVYVGDVDPEAPESLAPFIEAQRALLDAPRVDRRYDAKLESAHLDALARAAPTGEALARARRWLVGTLPLEVYGPPMAISTRDREDAQLEAFKRRATVALRWFLLGGGALFVAVAALSLAWAHREVARRTAEVLEEDELDVAEASRAMLARGGYVVGLLLITLLLTVLLLESLVFPG